MAAVTTATKQEKQRSEMVMELQSQLLELSEHVVAMAILSQQTWENLYKLQRG